MDLVYIILLVEHGIRDGKETHVGWPGQRTVDILRFDVRLKAFPARVYLSDRLLQTLLERTTDGHNLTDRLHRRADLAVHLRRELREIPLRDLRDDVVERGFEAGRGRLRYGVGKFWEGMSEGDFRGGVSERVASCLGSECTVQGFQ